MGNQRAALWLLFVVSSVFPVWFVYSSVVRAGLPFTGYPFLLFIVILPVIAMGVMCLWAVRVEAPPTAARDTRFKTIALVVFLGYIGAFIVLNRNLRKEESAPNA